MLLCLVLLSQHQSISNISVSYVCKYVIFGSIPAGHTVWEKKNFLSVYQKKNIFINDWFNVLRNTSTRDTFLIFLISILYSYNGSRSATMKALRLFMGFARWCYTYGYASSTNNLIHISNVIDCYAGDVRTHLSTSAIINKASRDNIICYIDHVIVI